MPRYKSIRRIQRSRPTVEGAGVRLKRAFGHADIPLYDPFLMLDDFGSEDPEDYRAGFPWHPHRGIETITYVLQGEVAHEDSLGNQGVIGAGDLQWMTAGSGIIHQEMPRVPADGRLRGIQLWANLPAAHKMTAPRYQNIPAARIPEKMTGGGVRLRVICGEAGGLRGPVAGVATAPLYLDVTLPPEGRWELPLAEELTAAAYVLAGGGDFAPRREQAAAEASGTVGPQTVVLFGEGQRIFAAAGGEGFRFLLLAGKPLGEPIAWQGPIVMNTRRQLETAFEEYRRGTFLKHGGG